MTLASLVISYLQRMAAIFSPMLVTENEGPCLKLLREEQEIQSKPLYSVLPTWQHHYEFFPFVYNQQCCYSFHPYSTTGKKVNEILCIVSA